MTLPLTPPTFVKRTGVEFAFPYTTPTYFINLPNPTFGNQETLSGSRVQTETRGGDLILYGDPTWPKDDQLDWTITNLKHLDKLNLEGFIRVTLGKEFRLTDHESLVWKAIITNPDAEIVQDGLGPRYTVNLTLNVVLMSWP
jgi:hypothetical protein